MQYTENMRVLVDDVEVEITGCGYCEPLSSEIPTCFFTLKRYQNIDDTVVIKLQERWRGQWVDVFKGQISTYEYERSARLKDRLTITAHLVPMVKWHENRLGKGTTQDDPVVQISDWIAANPNFGTKLGFVNYGINVKHRRDRQTYLTGLQELVENIGWEYRFDLNGDGNVEVKSKVGTSTSKLAIVIGKNATVSKWRRDVHARENKVWGIGRGINANNRIELALPAQDIASIARYGLKEGLIAAKNIVSEDDLLNQASAALTQRKTPPYRYELDLLPVVMLTIAPNYLRAGDNVSLTDSSCGLSNEKMRIYEVKIDWSKEGKTIRLVLSNRKYDLQKLLHDVLKYQEEYSTHPQDDSADPEGTVTYGDGTYKPLLQHYRTVDISAAGDHDWDNFLMDCDGNLWGIRHPTRQSYLRQTTMLMNFETNDSYQWSAEGGELQDYFHQLSGLGYHLGAGCFCISPENELYAVTQTKFHTDGWYFHAKVYKMGTFDAGNYQHKTATLIYDGGEAIKGYESIAVDAIGDTYFGAQSSGSAENGITKHPTVTGGNLESFGLMGYCSYMMMLNDTKLVYVELSGNKLWAFNGAEGNENLIASFGASMYVMKGFPSARRGMEGWPYFCTDNARKVPVFVVYSKGADAKASIYTINMPSLS